MSKRYIFILFIVVVAVSVVIKIKISQASQMNYKGIRYYQVYSLDKPDTLFFCEERVPVDVAAVSKKVSNEVYHYNYLRKHTNVIVKRVNYWFPIFEKILEKHGIPDDFKYLAVVESGLANVVSPRGAAGFWQFVPSTAISMGLIVNDEIDERYDPIKATHAACKYLKMAHKQLGNWTNVAAAYNMGISGLKRQLQVQRKKSYHKINLNNETGRYVYRIIALKEILSNQSKYGFTSRKIAYPAHKIITVKEPIPNLKAFAKTHQTTVVDLKEYNPWIVGEALTIEKPFNIKIPLVKKEKTTAEQTKNGKVVLDSVKPTPFKKDNIKEAIERSEAAEKKQLYLKKQEKIQH